MGIFLEDANLEQLLGILFAFLWVALLGWLLQQLVLWDSVLTTNYPIWLKGLRKRVRQWRYLRRAMEKAQYLPGIQLPPSLRMKWQVIRWIATAINATKWARS
jgi:hypothetical protein